MLSSNGSHPSPSRLKTAAFAAVAIATTLAAGTSFLYVRQAAAQGAAVASAFEQRAKAQAGLQAKSESLHKQQLEALERIGQLEDRLQAEPPQCDAIIPKYRYGVGILQVANVPASRGADALRFANAQRTRLLTLLGARKVEAWGQLLILYRGQEKEPLQRVVFNNVDPSLGARMCAWLRCEKWSGGCAFVDDRGAVHPEAAPTEYPQTEDLFELWKVASAAPSPKRGG